MIESSHVKSVSLSELNSWRHRTVGVEPLGSMPMSVPENVVAPFDDPSFLPVTATNTPSTLVVATTGLSTPRSLLVISQATENPEEKSVEMACEGCARPE